MDSYFQSPKLWAVMKLSSGQLLMWEGFQLFLAPSDSPLPVLQISSPRRSQPKGASSSRTVGVLSTLAYCRFQNLCRETIYE